MCSALSWVLGHLMQMSLWSAMSHVYRNSHPCVIRAPAEGENTGKGQLTQPGGQPGLPERGNV